MSSRAVCERDGTDLNDREIFQNDTDFTKNGSLMWILDKTLTKFGSRLLHSWVGKPLVNIEYAFTFTFMLDWR